MHTEQITAQRQRFLSIKDKLPMDWKGLMIREFPELSTYKGRYKLDNIHRGKSTPEERYLVFMEELVRDH